MYLWAERLERAASGFAFVGALGPVLAHRPDALLASRGGGFIAAAGLMNVKTVDEQPRKQQRQQACHKNDGDHFLHNFIPFPGELNLLLFVFARNFRSVWVKILVLIPFFALHAAWIDHGDAGKSRELTRRSYCRTPRA
jgi:hypothetical protein